MLENADPCLAQCGYAALFAALLAESLGLFLPGGPF